MAASPTDPAVLAALVAGGTGAVLLVQARLQARLLRRRIANGAATALVDQSTGLWAPSTAWQCIRAESNRSLRLGRPLDVWVGAADDQDQLDAHGRELVFDLAAGAMGIRIDDTHVCVLSCANQGTPPDRIAQQLRWTSTSIEPGEEAAASALAYVSEEVDHG